MFFHAIYEDFKVAVGPNASRLMAVRVALFDRGLHLLALYRLQVLALRIPGLGSILARLLWSVSATLYACEISYRAKIHPGVRIPHPTGIVIGYKVEIESGTNLQQNVTLGTKEAHILKDQDYRLHIKKGCFIGPGAVILGTVSIGPNANIGANAVVLKDVPPDTTAVGVPAWNLR